ncbi:hypothetical protein SDC9_204413 [bioreactor metagenome]|uniref:Uncharacterized protein n=1 Tax=bioreactor metagenome TaxID=1076179 RepID=A0A645IZH6_9ZZZZ
MDEAGREAKNNRHHREAPPGEYIRYRWTVAGKLHSYLLYLHGYQGRSIAYRQRSVVLRKARLGIDGAFGIFWRPVGPGVQATACEGIQQANP